MAKERIYRIWAGMKRRCENPNYSNYRFYGGRGIKVCENWRDFKSFYGDMKEGYDDNLTIDRIDNEGNYEPENCHWITKVENSKKGGKRSAH
jgi:hypothetical protein